MRDYILVVEDDVAAAERYANALESSLGYRVERTHSAQGAKRRVQKDNPCLVVLDLQLPVTAKVPPHKIVGFCLYHEWRLKRAFKRIPIIPITSHKDLTQVWDDLITSEIGKESVEGDLPLVKPFNLDELITVCKRALQLS